MPMNLAPKNFCNGLKEKKKTLVNSCSPDDMNDIFIFKQDPIIKLLYSPKF